MHEPKAHKRRRVKPHGETVVLVHGIWMHGVMMRVLGNYLQKAGYRTLQVSYDFLDNSPAENAAVVIAEIEKVQTPVVHLVGHSLGGIVILHVLQQHAGMPPGKVVLIGSPVRGSDLAAKIHARPVLRPLLGRSVEQGLLGGAPEFTSDRPLGVITGSRRLGVGAMVFDSDEVNDGAVSESETRLSGKEQRISIPYSHSIMIFSRRCARYVASFLATGRFD
jgi:pimeloyl-ACP methyl ester carboxylesterase